MVANDNSALAGLLAAWMPATGRVLLMLGDAQTTLSEAEAVDLHRVLGVALATRDHAAALMKENI